MITISCDDIYYVYNYSHVFTITVTYPDLPDGFDPLAPVIHNFSPVSIDSTRRYNKTVVYNFRVQPHYYVNLQGYITFSDGVSSTRNVHLFYTQNRIPLWRRAETVTIDGEEPLHYQVVDSKLNVIHEGVNIAAPGEDFHRIYLNNIVNNYVEVRDVMFAEAFEGQGGSGLFGLVIDGTLSHIFNFVWNYEYVYIPLEYAENLVLNRPINGHISSLQLQYLPFSVYTVDNRNERYDVKLTFTTGGTETKDLDAEYETPNSINTIWYNPNAEEEEIPPIKKVAISRTGRPTITYETGYCGEVALYYQNRLGGTDMFLIEGGVEKTDEFERDEISLTWDTDNSYAGKKSVFTNVNSTYKLTTGLLTDEESKILVEQLISSPCVMMFDIKNATFTRVNITDAKVTYQTFKNNGRKFAQYTIEVKDNNDKYIK